MAPSQLVLALVVAAALTAIPCAGAVASRPTDASLARVHTSTSDGSVPHESTVVVSTGQVTCESCVQASDEWGWCIVDNACEPGRSSGSMNGRCTVEAGTWAQSVTGCQQLCPAGGCSNPCTHLTTCDACTAAAECGWCVTDNVCEHGTSFSSDSGTCTNVMGTWLFGPDVCPVSCGTTNCGLCVQATGCGWCSSGDGTLGCIASSGTPPDCTTWSDDSCAADCSAFTDKADCTSDAGCGWCDAPAPGTPNCLAGSLYTPTSGSCTPLGVPSWHFIPPCDAYLSECECRTAPGSCGWCNYYGLCFNGTQAGPGSTTVCPDDTWAFGTPVCSAHDGNCTACSAEDCCKFCGPTMQCVAASDGDDSFGACPNDAWATQCCDQFLTECECLHTIDLCGWCAQPAEGASSCQLGVSTPTDSAACSIDAWTPGCYTDTSCDTCVTSECCGWCDAPSGIDSCVNTRTECVVDGSTWIPGGAGGTADCSAHHGSGSGFGDGFWDVGGVGFDTVVCAASAACLCVMCGRRREWRCCQRAPPRRVGLHNSRSPLLGGAYASVPRDDAMYGSAHAYPPQDADGGRDSRGGRGRGGNTSTSTAMQDPLPTAVPHGGVLHPATHARNGLRRAVVRDSSDGELPPA